MKALVLQAHGGLEQVKYAEIVVPEIGPDEVLLAVKAAALNGLDLWVVAGWRGLNLAFPHVLGSDGAGVVTRVGAQVTNVSVGDRVAVNPTVGCGKCAYCLAGREHQCVHFAVLGEHIPGFYADQIAVPARNLLALPAQVSFAEAAAASLVFITAWHSLITRGRLQAGEDVLIVGAGGGVNTAAIQVARLAGAGTIYVVGSTDEKLATAQELGADVLINRREEPNWSKAVYLASGKQGVNVVVDNVGAATYTHSLRCLAKGGRLLTVGNTSGPTFEFDNRLIFGKHLAIIGSTMGPQADFVTVMELVFSGRLRPVIDSVYPLREGVTALQRLERGEVSGKLVLEPGL
jgi:NADPH:quinone reductase-like Zn-dependent oxidoreductase